MRRLADPFRKVMVIEANLGQYVYEVERTLRDKSVEFYGKMDGKLISPGDIEEAVRG